MDRVQVRHITKADVEPLATRLAHMPNQQTMANRFAESVDGQREMLVALIGGVTVGTVSIGGSEAADHPGALFLFALDVAPGFRQQGVATALMKKVESLARAKRLGAVDLKVGANNPNATRLYRTLGYVVSGEDVVEAWTEHAPDGTAIEMHETWTPMRKRL